MAALPGGAAGMAQPGPEPARVVEALELLLGPPGSAAEPGREPALCPEALRRNALALEERLSRAAGWAALRELRAAVLSRAPALAAGAAGAEPGWAAACGLLALLLCLKERLAALAAAPAAPAAPGAPPPPGADTLSVGQERAVRRALRAAVGLGLLPHLPLGLGTGLGTGLGPAPGSRGARLLAAVAALVELARLPALGAPLLARHLRLLLCGLCALGHGPAALCQGVSEAERAQCREALRDILDRVYQPLAVQELLVLQGQPKQRCPGAGAAPAWLRRLCGHLLSERLLRPGGVHAVVRGVLEGTDGGAGAEAAALDWRKCDAVGKILAACPQQCLSLEDYYRQVCPQILDLLHIQDKVAARQFQRVATSTLLSMAREQPELAERHLLQPLLAPLRRCSRAAELALQDLTAGAVLVPEAELGSCVEDVLKVYVVGNDSSSLLLGSLQPVLGVVFSLYSFAKQNVSYLRSPCQDILLWFLEKAEREQSLAVLESLAGLSSHVPPLHPQCQLRVGSEGGAAIVLEETISDEDEALYQKISLEQCHVESLVELLSHCQKSGLAGDFFIHCLKELTQVAAEDEEAPNPAVQPAGSLLELEQYQARQGRRLLVLQLVAALCEGVSDTVFTDIVQVQQFLAAVLQRACAHPARGPGAAAEAQTLAMAMGLVAAVLGGAVQLKSGEFAVLKRLVPLLEELSRTYPEPLTQELASDLRIAILTHGACCPGTLGTAADAVLGRTAGTAAQGPAGTAAPSPAGTPAPSPAGTAAPSLAGTTAQGPAGTAAPSPAGTTAPSPAGTAAPSPAGTAAPSPAGTAAPSPAGTAAPSPAGTTAQGPAGTAAQGPAGTAAPSPAGTAAPSPAGTAAPSPAGTTAQGPAGTAAPSLAGTAAQSPAGTAAPSPAGTAAQSPVGRVAQSPAGTTAQSLAGTAAQSPAGTAAQSPAGTTAQSLAGTAAQSPVGRVAQSPAGTTAPSPAGTAPGPAAPRHPHGSPSSAHRENSKEQSTAREPGASPAPGADSLALAGLQELLVSAYDPQPPSRAAALRRLASLVTQRHPEALRLQEKLLQVFLENVQHEDAFVYLSAIQGVALLSSEYPERILPVLLAQYECPAQGREDTMAAVTRMKLGEVLMRVTRALGDMVFQHREPLIHAFLRGARDPDSALRASSLSNLGELCQHLGFQLGSIIQEVTCCVTAIARTDPEAEVRRAAVHVVVLLLRGLSEKVTEVLQDVLLELYRLLKHVAAAERDAAAVLHAQLALQELDAAVRRVLFPPQTLQKKIVVLP